jgi:hypothetical protein
MVVMKVMKECVLDRDIGDEEDLLSNFIHTATLRRTRQRAYKALTSMLYHDL